MSVVIRSVASYVPEQRVTNDDLAKKIDTTDEWIHSHTGIRARHIAPDGMQTSDLATEAAKKALAKANVQASDLDFILVATATPDYFGFPGTACVVQDKLGASGCAAFDITAGCTGFIYTLDVASSMLEQHHGKHGLVIGAETLSRLVDWEDRSTAVLFGDGAGAAVVSRIDEPGRGVLSTVLGAEGSGALDLYMIQTPRTSAYTHGEPVVPKISMNGHHVYDFAVKAMTGLIERMLHETVYKLEDFAWIVPHQANARIVQAAGKRFGIPEDKFYMNIAEYANTSSASIPVALAEMEEKGLLKANDLIMLLGFGSGLTYGSAVIRW
jgi:3-oxoacyl-[acyl-carrier-protein] synthase-3